MKAHAVWFKMFHMIGAGLLLATAGYSFDLWPLGKKTDQDDKKTNAAPRSVSPIVVEKTPVTRDTRLTTSFSSVVKKVAPSVVNVFSSKTVRLPAGMNPFYNDPFLRRFFGFGDDSGGNSNPRNPNRQSPPHKEQGLGSGVIITKDGYILTNNHVVEGADEIKVGLVDGKKECVAKLVGSDPKTDVAVLKIDAKDLPAATLGDSDKLEVGDVVLAIGNPFGVGQTVTMGIVSALGRSNVHIADYENFIQTDASINPGNSGGALVDAEGRVVGINTAILSRTGGNLGIGFAVPINLARDIMERIIKDGRVIRGYLGIMIQPVTPELQKAFNLADSSGALVGEVTPGSAAEEAGLKAGDVIVEYDGKKVVDAKELRMVVSQMAPGKKVNLKAIREGKEKTFAVTLRELPADKQSAAGGEEPNSGAVGVLEGVVIADLNPEIRRQINAPEKLNGVVVMQVDPDSPAYDAGLREGDVIQEIDRKPVKDVQEALQASRKIGAVQALLRVWSKGASRFVVVSVSKKK